MLSKLDLDHVIEHTRSLWEDLRGERIFITGGTGFFGRWLLESFSWANDRLKLGATAHVLTRSLEQIQKKDPQLAANNALHWIQGEMTSCRFPSGTFSYVIHAAAEPATTKDNQGYLAQFDANTLGTRSILEWAAGSGTRRFLFTSSGAVYGKQPVDITHVSEEQKSAPDSTDPITAYAQSKRVSEFLCSSFAREEGLIVLIARCFAFVGPFLPLDANYAIGNFIRDALHGGPIQINGNGTPRRSYLYAADLAIWLWTILFKGQTCRAYNVGSESDVTIYQLAQQVAEVISPKAEIRVAKKVTPDEPIEWYVPSTFRARMELGLEAHIPLRSAIARTAEWYQSELAGSKTK